MDPRMQCPVCTLYLHSGMSLESHLDTHPKDQVIKALCSLSSKNTSYGSRTSTPTSSERSYRSRSRTPATEDSVKWMNSHKSADNDRYWRRTPSRTKSSTFSNNTSRNVTPDLRMGNLSFENHNFVNSNSADSYSMKLDRCQQGLASTTTPNATHFDQQYPFSPDQNGDSEIKYSRSTEYNNYDTTNNVFAYNSPSNSTNIKLQTTMVPPISKRANDIVKVLPKQGNIVVKTNVGGMQYITPGAKPLHVVMPPTSSFMQKNLPNNMIMSGNLPNAQILDRSVAQPFTNQFNQLPTGSFAPGTTVVTQNSQFIYREMVHSMDGKPFISNMPTVLGGHDNIANVTQNNSLYQNVMVVDQFGNTSCMYTTPQPLLPKPCSTSIFNDMSHIPNAPNKSIPETNNDADKTLIIEVNPITPTTPVDNIDTDGSLLQQSDSNSYQSKTEIELPSLKNEPSLICKGLKILSNVKVEVPVKHHKNMLNKVLDLTGPNDSEYIQHPLTSGKLLVDSDDNLNTSDDCTQPSFASSESTTSHTFSVIKNIEKLPSYIGSKESNITHKLECEFSDSCPVPDLICNEKASISPCSELSEQGDNATDHMPLSPKPECSVVFPNSTDTCSNSTDDDKKSSLKLMTKVTTRLNNIYVKKHKKILQIKNSKIHTSSTSRTLEFEPRPSSSRTLSPEHFSITKINNVEKDIKKSLLHAICLEKMKENLGKEEFNTNTEEHSMEIEIEPVTVSNFSKQYPVAPGDVQVKEEVNSSNDISNDPVREDTDIAPMESLRPINVITYAHMASDNLDDDSNDKELLELEAASKSKQFVTMMNENYFGDNIYADYFTPDRVESFDAEKESQLSKESTKHDVYVWGESSQKPEAEFVLPNFIHESYKIAESNEADYSDVATPDLPIEIDRCDTDNKADVLSESRSEGEPVLNICTDEKMPPRGELSGQESNGDIESPWSGTYSEAAAAEPYDLMARESWVSDGSDADTNEKSESLATEIQFAKARTHSCSLCCIKFQTLKELRSHKALVHVLPTCSNSKTSYSRLITSRTIKKEEEKPDDNLLATNLLALESKQAISSTILQVYDVLGEAKPKIEGLIKQERKRKRRDYVCPTCKEDQGSDLAFHAHLKIHPLECLTCGKCFFRRANLALHIKTHLGIKNYKCEVCEKRFITRQKLTEHHNIHTGRTPFKCTLCDDTFRRYSNMVQHRDRHHLKKKARVRDFVCHCGAVFHSPAKLLWHKETHEEKPKACLYCSDKFVHAASLTRHVRRTHNELYVSERARGKVDNVPCPVCKQVYLRTNLRAHLLTHSGKRPFHCVICNKYFTTKWNLKLHRWTHMSRSAKPYKCNLCKGAFIRHTEYVSHMNSHKSVRPYTCNYCGCQFIRKTNCQRHVREHETAKKYVCKVAECGKSFHRSYYLSEHMKVHSNARPFSCNVCGKTSSNKSNHNKHVKIHHAREPIATEA